jgi:hypothetical protein
VIGVDQLAIRLGRSTIVGDVAAAYDEITPRLNGTRTEEESWPFDGCVRSWR